MSNKESSKKSSGYYTIYVSACGKNEHIPKCKPCSPGNCGDKNDTICTQKCEPNEKCYCKPGYLRNKEGICVREAECGKFWNEYSRPK